MSETITDQDSGYTVELGDQVFTQAQWEAVQTHVEGSLWRAHPDAASWSPDTEPDTEAAAAIEVLRGETR